MAKKNFYAVKKGFKPGIYSTWDKCLKQVVGFPGAEYKGFATKEDAEEYLGIKPKETADINQTTYQVYTDGSLNMNSHTIGYGYLVVSPEGKVIRKEYGQVKKSSEVQNTLNVAGELKAVLVALKYCGEHNIHDIEICHDYTGISKWIMGEWKAKSPVAKQYIESYNKLLIKYDLFIQFKKVSAHCGQIFNEKADELAKLGAMSSAPKVLV